MIKKVTKIDLIPQDLQELIVPENGEYVPIGKNVYEIFPFSIQQYLTLLGFIGKYFNSYNSVIEDGRHKTPLVFFGLLAEKLIEDDLMPEFFKIFPDLEEDFQFITKDQLVYFLGMIYKLNFLLKKNPMQNMENRAATTKMLEMLGLTILNPNS